MKLDDVKSIIMIAKEHNRLPGAFDYSVPQKFFSCYPEIDSESYITLGAGDSIHARRRVHQGVITKTYD